MNFIHVVINEMIKNNIEFSQINIRKIIGYVLVLYSVKIIFIIINK